MWKRLSMELFPSSGVMGRKKQTLGNSYIDIDKISYSETSLIPALIIMLIWLYTSLLVLHIMISMFHEKRFGPIKLRSVSCVSEPCVRREWNKNASEGGRNRFFLVTVRCFRRRYEKEEETERGGEMGTFFSPIPCQQEKAALGEDTGIIKAEDHIPLLVREFLL